jgi:ribose-phosphate pyrophosphokinase
MKDFKVITMPGGEQHVTLLANKTRQAIRVEGIPTAEKLIAAGLAVEVRKRVSGHADLVLPYLPGARQDRLDIPEVGYSNRVYARLLESFNADSLTILDPHSKEALAELKSRVLNVNVIPHEVWFLRWVESTTFKPGPHKFLFPDKGAAEKYSKVPAYSPLKSCKKLRDPSTGKLSGFEVPSLRGWEDNFVWIVDDICDGGGTFISIAEQIRAEMGNRVVLGLAVSHGIFSKGVGRLNTLFDYLVTTDSVYEGQFGKCVHVQPLSPILKEMGINA